MVPPQIICSCLRVRAKPVAPPLTSVAVTIDLYDPFCSHASLQNRSSSSRSACSGFVRDRWKTGNLGWNCCSAAAPSPPLYLKWENYRGDLWDHVIVAALLKLYVASLKSGFIRIISYSIAKPTSVLLFLLLRQLWWPCLMSMSGNTDASSLPFVKCHLQEDNQLFIRPLHHTWYSTYLRGNNNDEYISGLLIIMQKNIQ